MHQKYYCRERCMHNGRIVAAAPNAELLARTSLLNSAIAQASKPTTDTSMRRATGSKRDASRAAQRRANGMVGGLEICTEPLSRVHGAYFNGKHRINNRFSATFICVNEQQLCAACDCHRLNSMAPDVHSRFDRTYAAALDGNRRLEIEMYSLPENHFSV
jgi:hypothetical protein